MNFSGVKSIIGKVKSLQALLPPPLREILSEADGTGSYSRTVGFMIVVATLGWTTYLVLHNHAFPDMTGPTLFIGGGAGTSYGLNQMKNVAAAVKTGIAPGTPAPTAPPTGGPPNA
jgi:hypothetical protein